MEITGFLPVSRINPILIFHLKKCIVVNTIKTKLFTFVQPIRKPFTCKELVIKCNTSKRLKLTFSVILYFKNNSKKKRVFLNGILKLQKVDSRSIFSKMVPILIRKSTLIYSNTPLKELTTRR